LAIWARLAANALQLGGRNHLYFQEPQVGEVIDGHWYLLLLLMWWGPKLPGVG
jgi:hypothetical protein